MIRMSHLGYRAAGHRQQKVAKQGCRFTDQSSEGAAGVGKASLPQSGNERRASLDVRVDLPAE